VRANIGGKRIWFDTIGPSLRADHRDAEDRPTILALHGGPGVDHTSVRGVVEPLADLGQIVLIDQCGHGRSDYGDTSQWTLESWAADIASFCEVLDIRKPVLFGASFGAMVALAVAGMFPDLPAALVLSNSGAGLVDHNSTVEVFRRLGGDEVANIAWQFLEEPAVDIGNAYEEICLPHYSRRPGAHEYASSTFAKAVRTPEVGAYFQSRIHSLDPTQHAAAVRCRTLIICGTDDVMVPRSVATDLLHMFPHGVAQLEFVPDAGHWLYRDNPEHAYGILRRFISASD
jgi:pimeloyl-ACP methyl ester carboxylesterase